MLQVLNVDGVVYDGILIDFECAHFHRRDKLVAKHQR